MWGLEEWVRAAQKDSKDEESTLTRFVREAWAAQGQLEKQKGREKEAPERLPLTEGEKRVLSSLQQYLRTVAPEFVKLPTIAESIQESEAERIAKAVEKEQQEGVFGPATREAYANLVEWMRHEVPLRLKQLVRKKLPIPPGCPIPVPTDENGLPLLSDLDTSNLRFDPKLDVTRLTTLEDLLQLRKDWQWLAAASSSVQGVLNGNRSLNVRNFVKDYNLPKSWNAGPNDLPGLSAAEGLISLYTCCYKHVKEMIKQFKATKPGDNQDRFPLNFPPGTDLEITCRNRRYFLKNVDRWTRAEDGKSITELLTQGEVTKITLVRPDDLRINHKSNRDKIDVLRRWFDSDGKKILDINSLISQVKDGKQLLLMYANIELKNSRALIDKDGKLKDVVGLQNLTPLAPGDRFEKTNLVKYDFKVEEIQDGPDKGKYRILSIAEAKRAGVFSAFNVIGVDHVATQEISWTVDKDSFIPLAKGNGVVELVHVRNLADEHFWMATRHNLNVATSAALDLALVGGGALKLGALLSKPGRKAAQISAKEIAGEAGHAGFSLVLGGTGIFNNAGAREKPALDLAMKVRHGYIATHVMYSLFSPLFFRKAQHASKVEAIIKGAEGGAKGKAVIAVGSEYKGIPFVKQAYAANRGVSLAAELTMIPLLHHELTLQIEAVSKRKDLNPIADMVGNLDGFERTVPLLEKRQSHGKLALLPDEALDEYGDILKRGCSPAVQREIDDILKATSKALKGSPADRKELINRLFKRHAFTPEDVIKIGLSAPPGYRKDRGAEWITSSDLNALLDPEKRKSYPAPVRLTVERILAARDADVSLVQAIALLALLQKNAVGSNGAADSYSISVPNLLRTNSLKYDTDAKDLVAFLSGTLSNSSRDGRDIVIGEVLTKLGALSHQSYGAALEDVLTDPESTPQDKLRALTSVHGGRLAYIVESLADVEIDEAKDGKRGDAGTNAGTTADDFAKLLQRTAENEADAGVRAVAAALLYAIKQPNRVVRRQLLAVVEKMSNGKRASSVELGRSIADWLEIETGPISTDKDGMRRLLAAQSLLLLGKKDDGQQQLKIAEAIAGAASQGSRELTVAALNDLTPELLESLASGNPEMLRKLTDIALHNITNIDGAAGAVAAELIIDKLVPDSPKTPFITRQPPAVRAVIAGALDKLLNDEGNSDKVRAAALVGLSRMFGNTADEQLLLPRLSKQPFKRDGKTIAAAEKSPVVRAVAGQELLKKGTNLSAQEVQELAVGETDLAVKDILLALRAAVERIAITTVEGSKKFEETLSALTALNDYPYLRKFNAAAWLAHSDMGLLDGENFSERAKEKVQHAAKWTVGDRLIRWSNPWTSNELDLVNEGTAAEKLGLDRAREFKSLVKLACDTSSDKGRSEESNKAKQALADIVRKRVAVQPEKVDSVTRPGTHHRVRSNLVADAAHAFIAIAEAGGGDQKLVLYLIDGMLADNGVPCNVRLDLLKALKVMTNRERKNAIPPYQAATIVARALVAETRSPNPNDAYVRQLLTDLRQYGAHSEETRLQAIANKDTKLEKETKALALEINAEHVEQVTPLWASTKSNNVSDARVRAREISAALASGKTSASTEHAVRRIFSVAKGHTAARPDDPAVQALAAGLKHENVRLRLASAMALSQLSLPVEATAFVEAQKAMIDLLLHSPGLGIRKDACLILDGLRMPPGDGGARESVLMLNRDHLLQVTQSERDKVNRTVVKELKRKNGQLSVSAYIYENGGGFEFVTGSNGEVAEVVEDGVRLVRQPNDDWLNSRGEKVKRGKYSLSPDGSYRFKDSEKGRDYLRYATGEFQDRIKEGHDQILSKYFSHGKRQNDFNRDVEGLKDALLECRASLTKEEFATLIEKLVASCQKRNPANKGLLVLAKSGNGEILNVTIPHYSGRREIVFRNAWMDDKATRWNDRVSNQVWSGGPQRNMYNGEIEALKKAIVSAREALNAEEFKRFIFYIQSTGAFEIGLDSGKEKLVSTVFKSGKKVFDEQWKSRSDDEQWRGNKAHQWHDKIIDEVGWLNENLPLEKKEKLENILCWAARALPAEEFSSLARRLAQYHKFIDLQYSGTKIERIRLAKKSVFSQAWLTNEAQRWNDKVGDECFAGGTWDGDVSKLSNLIRDGYNKFGAANGKQFIKNISEGTSGFIAVSGNIGSPSFDIRVDGRTIVSVRKNRAELFEPVPLPGFHNSPSAKL